MPFVTVPGLKGKVYAPEGSWEIPKKHPCADCFSCQQCSDDRCRVCLRTRQGCSGNKIKINEDNPALLKSVAPCNCVVTE
jgi:hypothetical protein